MSKVYLVLAYVFLELTLVLGENLGENLGELCDLEEAEGAIGTCQPDYLCSYTDHLINVEMKKPTSCFINTTHRLVCCPKYNYQIGPLSPTFVGSHGGKLKSNDIECRYGGKYPLICCNRRQSTNELAPRFLPSFSSIRNAFQACNRYSEWRKSGAICPQETSNKISGGEPADIQEFPHMVVLGCRNIKKTNSAHSDIEWIGAGTLITQTFVLTAAHALYSNDFGNIEFALLGASNKSDIRSGILRYIVQRKYHKLYITNTHYNDIALVELDDRIPVTKFTRPACLPVKGIVSDVIPTNMVIAGWGETGQHLHTSKGLRKGDVNIQSTSECTEKLKSRSGNFNPDLMICAKSESADTCQGDSGGPLMAPIESRLCGYYVIGIVSYGSVCGRNNSAAYTRVNNPEYLKWITETVWPGSN